MTITVIAEKVSNGPGTVGPFPSFLLHAGESADVRWNPRALDWDLLDPLGVAVVRAELVVDKSIDGGATFTQEKRGQFVGASHVKGGGFPSINVANLDAGDRYYRVSMILNSRFIVGLNLETQP